MEDSMKLICLCVCICIVLCTGLCSAGLNDTNFSIYNEGDISYFIYMHSYAGDDPIHHKDSFIGELKSKGSMSLNDNASYKLYATYNDNMDLGSVEYVENKFNQWWFIVIIVIILLIAGVKLYRVIKK